MSKTPDLLKTMKSSADEIWRLSELLLKSDPELQELNEIKRYWAYLDTAIDSALSKFELEEE